MLCKGCMHFTVLIKLNFHILLNFGIWSFFLNIYQASIEKLIKKFVFYDNVYSLMTHTHLCQKYYYIVLYMY